MRERAHRQKRTRWFKPGNEWSVTKPGELWWFGDHLARRRVMCLIVGEYTGLNNCEVPVLLFESIRMYKDDRRYISAHRSWLMEKVR